MPRRGKNNFKIAFDKIWVHGFTHLLGYRHKSDSDYLKMRKFEKNILKAINFNDRKNSK